MCKISLWSLECILNQSTANFGRISNSIEKSLVGWAPGNTWSQCEWCMMNVNIYFFQNNSWSLLGNCNIVATDTNSPKHCQTNYLYCTWYKNNNNKPLSLKKGNTVGTPYNTAPYITGSNIARLGHGSQNSWSKLWIPIVKSAPVRVIFTWKGVPKKSIHGSSDIYLGTQWKQRHDSPWSYRSDAIVTFLWYGTIGIIWHRDHQSTAKKV